MIFGLTPAFKSKVAWVCLKLREYALNHKALKMCEARRVLTLVCKLAWCLRMRWRRADFERKNQIKAFPSRAEFKQLLALLSAVYAKFVNNGFRQRNTAPGFGCFRFAKLQNAFCPAHNNAANNCGSFSKSTSFHCKARHSSGHVPVVSAKENIVANRSPCKAVKNISHSASVKRPFLFLFASAVLPI